MNKFTSFIKRNVLEILSLFVAFLALFNTAYQSDLSHKHNRLSVMPLMDIAKSYGDSDGNIYLSIENNGLGPAIINGIELVIDDEYLITGNELKWIYILDRIEKKYKIAYSDIGLQFAEINKYSIIKPGEKIKLLALPPSAPLLHKRQLRSILQQIDVLLCYRSIYGDRLVNRTNKTPPPDQSCIYADAINIWGFKFLFKWPWEQPIQQNEIFGY